MMGLPRFPSVNDTAEKRSKTRLLGVCFGVVTIGIIIIGYTLNALGYMLI
jgi:hypothetical protein